MKGKAGSWDSPNVQAAVSTMAPRARERQLDVEAVYQQTVDFAWRTLQRLGVPESDLEDVLQEVYVVVHRRLPSYGGQCRLTTWVFGICRRVANRHRRRAWFRRQSHTAVEPSPVDERTPEEAAARSEARRQLETILGKLGPELRAVFVMFEVEGQSCQDIAELMGVPVGTVHSRLHTARKRREKAAAKLGGPKRTGEKR